MTRARHRLRQTNGYIHRGRRTETSTRHLIPHGSQKESGVLAGAQNTLKNQYEPDRCCLPWGGQVRTDEGGGRKLIRGQMPSLITNGKEFQKATVSSWEFRINTLKESLSSLGVGWAFFHQKRDLRHRIIAGSAVLSMRIRVKTHNPEVMLY